MRTVTHSTVDVTDSFEEPFEDPKNEDIAVLDCMSTETGGSIAIIRHDQARIMIGMIWGLRGRMDSRGKEGWDPEDKEKAADDLMSLMGITLGRYREDDSTWEETRLICTIQRRHDGSW